MPFILEPQPGEEVLVRKEFRGSNKHIFAMAVSNQAVYVSAQKFVVRGDTWYLKRVPLVDIKEVCLIKQKPVYMILASVILIVLGLLVSFVMMWQVLHPIDGMIYHVSGWPFASVVAGVIIPFITRGRRVLVVKMQKGTFKWKPQLSIDKKTRELCASIQNELLEACKNVGIQVVTSP